MAERLIRKRQPEQGQLFTTIVEPETAAAITYLEAHGLPLYGHYGYMNAVWVADQVKARILLEAAP